MEHDGKFEVMLAELRRRVKVALPTTTAEGDALTRALHELDVYHAELVIQNQDLRETQAALGVARDRYRMLFEECLVPVVSLSQAGSVLEANDAALAFLGRSRSSLVGKPLVVCLAHGELDAYFHHLKAVVASSVPQTVELTFKAHAGASRVVMRTGLLRQEGAPTLLCHLTDVTAQRATEAEREKLALRLRDAERLEAVGRVAANIAHEVNNVLSSVITLAEFAAADAAPHTPLARDMESLLDAAWRGARLMRGLLGLSRGTAAEPRLVDVNGLTERVAAFLKRKKAGVLVEVEGEDAPVPVLGDEDELLQAFLNIATNGIEAMESGTLTLRCSVLSESSRGLDASPVARIEFRDSGTGMSAETVSRVFEPLFTTKAAVGGSGLGLSMVHKTISGHRGAVGVESSPGIGTTVTVELPLELRLGKEPSAKLETTTATLTMTVLLVDDDDRVRASTQRQLESLGATVQAFTGGPPALDAVNRGLAFDAAVVDVNMPFWSGPDTVARIFDSIGPVPVVFVTGASGELIPAELLARDHVRLVRKPWTHRDLVLALRHVERALSSEHVVG